MSSYTADDAVTGTGNQLAPLGEAETCLYFSPDGKAEFTTCLRLSDGRHIAVDADVEEWARHKTIFLTAGYPSMKSRRGRGAGTIYLHRLVMDAPKEMDIDHINGDKMDCRRSNLRVATRKQNVRNSKPRFGRKFKGVSVNQPKPHHKKSWAARIKVNGVQHNLGYFPDEITAARAYNEAAKKYFGEFAWLNPV